jgi:hypothetical protein
LTALTTRWRTDLELCSEQVCWPSFRLGYFEFFSIKVEILSNDLNDFDTMLTGWLEKETLERGDNPISGIEDIDNDDPDYQQRRQANIERFQRDLDRQRRIGAIDKQVKANMSLSKSSWVSCVMA